MKQRMRLNKQSDMNVVKEVKLQELTELEEQKKELAMKVKRSQESFGSELSEHPVLEKVNAEKKEIEIVVEDEKKER